MSTHAWGSGLDALGRRRCAACGKAEPMVVGCDLREDIVMMRQAANRLDGADPEWCRGTDPDRLLILCSPCMGRSTWSELDVVVAFDGAAGITVGEHGVAIGRWPAAAQPAFQPQPGAWVWEGRIDRGTASTARWRRATPAEWAAVAEGRDPWP